MSQERTLKKCKIQNTVQLNTKQNIYTKKKKKKMILFNLNIDIRKIRFNFFCIELTNNFNK